MALSSIQSKSSIREKQGDKTFLKIKGLKIQKSAFNSLPNGKILALSKLNVFADNARNAIQKLKFLLGRVENIVCKGENACYQPS